MKTNPLISIVIPVYNCEFFLDETISSVLNQTYSNWELILVDDKSTDRSCEIIKRYSEKDPRIKFLKHRINQGVSVARNTALDICNGDFIAFLDSDDIWDEDKLRMQINTMLENDLALCHTAYRKINEKGTLVSKKIPVTSKIGYKDLLKHNEIGLSTSIYNVKKVGKPYFGTIARTDYTYWLGILKRGFSSIGINQPLVSYRLHSNSISYNKIKSARKTWQVYRDVEKLPLLTSIYYFSFYAFLSGRKYFK